MNRKPASNRHGSLAAIPLALAIASCGRGTSFSPRVARGPTTIDAIDAELHRLEAGGFTGVVLLAKGDRVVLERGYGFADRESRRAMTPATGFDIGSLVKPFTAAAILTLERDGKLHRGDTLDRYFPETPVDKRAITIAQLLEHTSGLADIVDARGKATRYTPEFDYEPVTREEIARRAMASTLLFAPGSKSEYSNLGYSLLGIIIEIASGEPYEAYVRSRIFGPAGMKRTGYGLAGWRREELAIGYVDGAPWGTPLDHAWLQDGPSWNLRANGGMLANARELFAWLRALDRGTVLDAESKSAFFDLSVHTTKRGSRVIGPAGGNGVFDAVYAWFVDEGRILIVLTSDPRVRAEAVMPPLIQAMRAAGE
jgi:CubicO group peptidase (beta-lactamase class C family)